MMIERRKKSAFKPAGIGLALGLCLAWSPFALAGSFSGATTNLIPGVVNSGGQDGLSSANNNLIGDVGELGLSTYTSANYILQPGFSNLMAWPETVLNLSASTGTLPGSVTLKWTAPKADGSTGTAAAYEIRYATTAANSPAVSEAKFLLAHSVTDFMTVPAPSLFGTTEQLTITGLDGSTYYFAVKAQASWGGWSYLSNGTTVQNLAVSIVVSTDAPVRQNNATRATTLRLDVANNSRAGFGPVYVSSVNFMILDSNLAAFSQVNAHHLFNAIMLVRDSTSGLQGIYEPGIDITTAAYVPMNLITLDAQGGSTLTVSAQFISRSSVPAASTQTFFVVFEATQNASAYAPNNVFRVGFTPQTGISVNDVSSGQLESFIPPAALNTSSVTIIASSGPPTGTNWPYVTPSSASISADVATYFGPVLPSTRTYIASTDGTLRAVNSAGVLLWTFNTHPLSAINTSLDIRTDEGSNVYIYFADDNGDVYKIQDTGASPVETWSPSPSALGSVSARSLIDSGTKLYIAGSNNNVYCVYKSTGGQCTDWTHPVQVDAPISGTLCIDDRTGIKMAWVGLEDGKVVSLKTGDGSYYNYFQAGTMVKSSPYLDAGLAGSGNNLYITSTNGWLYARTSANLTTSPSGWSDFNAGAPIYSSPFPFYTATYSVPYIFFGDDAGRLHKISTATAHEALGGAWPFQAGGAIRSSPTVVPYWYIAGLAVGEDYVYFGCDDGYIYAVNANTGVLKTGWPVATGGAVRADPVIDQDVKTLTVGSGDGKVYTIYIGP